MDLLNIESILSETESKKEGDNETLTDDDVTQWESAALDTSDEARYIRSKEEFHRNYELIERKHLSDEEEEIFSEYRFYPVKNKASNKIFVITPEKNIRFVLQKLEDKKPFFTLLKYAKDRSHIIFCPAQVFFDIVEQTSVIDKEYSEDEAKEFFDALLQEANRRNASDIHITWLSDSVEIKYRIDGKVVRNSRKISKDLGVALRNILVSQAGESEYEENEVAGQLTKIVDGVKKEYRISIGPTVHGYNIVIRAETVVSKNMTLESKGYTPKACSLIRKLFKKNHGIILVTGPTGSGKSTLLATCIVEKLNEDPKFVPEILTVEDPVEMVIEGVNQTQVNTKGAKDRWITFASAIKMFLRQDPDMIVVGEIRDPEVAMQAVTAAKTGHLTASTLHTNDVASTFTRLNELGVDNTNIEDGVVGVISQRLINKLCDNCKIAEEKEGRKVYRRNPEGCPECLGFSVPGCKGRVPITEIAVMQTGRENYKPENFEDYYSMEENVIELLENGIIDEEEASRYTKINFEDSLVKRKEIIEIWNSAIQEKKLEEEATRIFGAYQQIIDKFDYTIGYEVYMRIRDSRGEIMYPQDFMSLIKDMNMYGNFSMFLLQEISEMAKKFEKMFFWNADTADLVDEKSVEEIISRVTKERIKEHIVIEIPFEKEEYVKNFIERCNRERIRVCVNSFDGNISDVVFLQRNGLFVDYIKTGEIFASGVQRDESWVEDYINLIHTINPGTKIIASFIETEKLLSIIREKFGNKIYGYQGFGIGNIKRKKELEGELK